jgi:hypothetical protein
VAGLAIKPGVGPDQREGGVGVNCQGIEHRPAARSVAALTVMGEFCLVNIFVAIDAFTSGQSEILERVTSEAFNPGMSILKRVTSPNVIEFNLLPRCRTVTFRAIKL